MPLTLGYAFMGLAVGAVFVTNPEVLALIPEGNPDYMVPTVVLTYMPHGIKALIFAAILAAAVRDRIMTIQVNADRERFGGE